VWISGNCWWHGVVDKGCGNQVFDYATVVPLLQSHQPHQPMEQKPNKTRPLPKSTNTSVMGSSPSKPPSFLTVDGGGAKLPRSNSSDKGGMGGLPRSTSNDGKKISVQEQATRNVMSKSLPPRGEDEAPRYSFFI
jgi:hypothetical protein